MKTLAEWLDRGSAPKKPRKRIPKVTAKRAKANREYAKRRKAFLLANTHCEAWHAIIQWMYKHDEKAYYTSPQFRPVSDDLHHRCKRGKNFLNEETWMSVSRWAHNWIHAHPKEARALGLLA